MEHGVRPRIDDTHRPEASNVPWAPRAAVRRSRPLRRAARAADRVAGTRREAGNTCKEFR